MTPAADPVLNGSLAWPCEVAVGVRTPPQRRNQLLHELRKGGKTGSKCGFPKIGVPQKWMVYTGKSIYTWMICGYPYLRKPLDQLGGWHLR